MENQTESGATTPEAAPGDFNQAVEGIRGMLFPDTDKDSTPEPEETPEAADVPEDGDLDEIEEESPEELDEEVVDETIQDEPFVPITFEVDGETIELGSLDDVKSGYLRHSDYTRKTQAHSEQVRTWTEQARAYEGQLVQQAQVLVQKLQLVEQELAGAVEPDWDTLSPDETKVALAAWNKRKSDLAVIQQERLEQQNMIAMQQQQEQQAFVERERSLLLSAKPEWQNPEVQKKDFEAITGYMANLGFTAEEIASVVDHRFFSVLHDAARFAAFDKAAPKPTRKSKASAPGAGRTASPNKRKKQRRQQARQSNSLRDHAAALKDIL